MALISRVSTFAVDLTAFSFGDVLGVGAGDLLLVLGLLIAPPAAAAMVTRRIPTMMALSATIAALSAPVGLLVSWHLDVAAGASIVMVAVGSCLAILAARPRRA